MECWLRPNRRALALGLVLPALLLALGLMLALGPAYLVSGVGWRGLGVVMALLGAWLATSLIYHLCLPRLGYKADQLCVYLRSGAPFHVPIDVVEVFFKGQGQAAMRGPDGVEPEVDTIVVRLAEAATEFKQRDVKPQLGQWLEGYITIRGTWCEPITPELIRRLNARLIEAHRARKKQREASS